MGSSGNARACGAQWPQDPPGRSMLYEYANAVFFRLWEDATTNEILKDVDTARVGGGAYVMDAGWWDTPGDWTASPTSFGLKPIIDKVHKRECCLVFIWRLKADTSKIAKEHPDWLMPNTALLNLSPK